MSDHVLVTGSSGHLGEALVRQLRDMDLSVRGLDIKPCQWTDMVGSITDPAVVARAMEGIDIVLHTATLHKPHIATHSRQAFVDINISGTLCLLEEAARANIKAFVFTSTTSVYGDALIPPANEPAAWITEAVQPVPKNIYGATKSAAEDLCQIFHRNQGLPVVILRTSRFFPEADDNGDQRAAFDDANLKTIEFLHRRVAIEDVVEAHILAMQRAGKLGFDRFVISANTPFCRDDLAQLRTNPAMVLENCLPGSASRLGRLAWRMFDRIDRIYVNKHARERLGWRPKFDFENVLSGQEQGLPWQGELAQSIGCKGYHDRFFKDGPFPVE